MIFSYVLQNVVFLLNIFVIFEVIQPSHSANIKDVGKDGAFQDHTVLYQLGIVIEEYGSRKTCFNFKGNTKERFL